MRQSINYSKGEELLIIIYEHFEDTNAVIRSSKWKDRKYHGNRKKTNNDRQNTTQKTKD